MDITPVSQRSMPGGLMDYVSSDEGSAMVLDVGRSIVVNVGDAVRGIVTHQRTPLALPYQVPGSLMDHLSDVGRTGSRISKGQFAGVQQMVRNGMQRRGRLPNNSWYKLYWLKYPSLSK